jgi:outer membrane protein OmpA-like peptidoglycan-associated protein
MPRFAFLLLLLCSFSGGVRAADDASRRFVVYFSEWSAALDDSARAVIADAATLAKARPHAVVDIVGFADPSASKQASILLSELRAQRVADLLQHGGVSVSRIHPIGRGSVRFAMIAQESRRVEIAVGAR